MLTEKENILRMYRGEMPEYLPRFGMQMARCSYFPNVKTPGYHVDEFGVEYIGKEGIFDGTPIPYPGRFILHDIRRWRDDVRIPSLEGIDWERLDDPRRRFVAVATNCRTGQPEYSAWR